MLTDQQRKELVAELGIVRDNVLATRYGISSERVRQIRSQLGIPRVSASVPLDVLGSAPDSVIAVAVQLHPNTVTKLRRAAGIPRYLVPCPSDAAYSRGCRCALCKRHHADKIAKQLAERPALRPDDPRHGTPNGYANWKCRCDRCRAACTAQTADRRAERRRALTRPARAV